MAKEYRERPQCRKAIEKFGLRLHPDGFRAINREGCVVSISDGIRKQLQKQNLEEQERA